MSNLNPYSNKEGIAKAFRNALRFLRPPPKLLPSEWAEQSIRIPVGNAIPGLINFDNAPYQREPLNMLADPKCYRVTLMWGAQVGKTQLVNCALGYFIAHEPVSQMMMQPSQGDLNTWLETKFNPMVDSNVELKNRIAKPRSREGVNNQQIKSYPGGFLMFSWAGSPRTMRGRSAPKIYCDEVDGYDYTAEGHPVNLLWQRAATFGDQRKLFVTSTPTIKGQSFIESSFETGDMRRYFVPCPHCGEHQTLKWSGVHWEKDPEGNHLPETATYVCEHCGVLLNDADKLKMLKNGEWRAEKPFTGHASYHLNELYSSFRKWRDIVQSFLEKKANNDLQTFVNVSLAETWEEEGDKADPEALATMVENYDKDDHLPEIHLVTFGTDVQQDRVETTYTGWTTGMVPYIIHHSVIWGDTTEREVWDGLDKELQQRYCGHKVAAGLVDSGFNTTYVYKFTKSKQGRKIFSAKGVAGSRDVVSNPTQAGAIKAMRVNVGVDVVKRMLLGMLKAPGDKIHFSSTLTDEYFKQLTAEKMVVRNVKGFQVVEWHKIRDRNEATDCFVYSYAAMAMLNTNWKRVIKNAEIKANPPEKEKPIEVVEEIKKPPRLRRKARQRGGFVRNY